MDFNFCFCFCSWAKIQLLWYNSIEAWVLFYRLWFFHSTGKDYYLNVYTKESQWEVPTEAAARLSDKVACLHLLVKHRDSRRPSSWKEQNITRSKEEALELLKGNLSSYVSKQLCNTMKTANKKTLLKLILKVPTWKNRCIWKKLTFVLKGLPRYWFITWYTGIWVGNEKWIGTGVWCPCCCC